MIQRMRIFLNLQKYRRDAKIYEKFKIEVPFTAHQSKNIRNKLINTAEVKTDRKRMTAVNRSFDFRFNQSIFSKGKQNVA